MPEQFETLAPNDIAEACKKAIAPELRNAEKAIDYLEGSQYDHVSAELGRRFPSTQSDASVDAPIQPVTFPLAQKFVEDSATVYAEGATREIVDDSGKVNEQLTETLINAADESRLDQTMLRVEGLTYYLKSCGVWPQLRHGRLKFRTVYPNKVYAVPTEDSSADPSDLKDYAAILIRLDLENWAYVSQAQTSFLVGKNIESLKPRGETHENGLFWEQWRATDSGDSVREMLPLMPFAFATYRESNDSLVPSSDCEVCLLNEEINVSWSSLMDTHRYQSFAQPWVQRAAGDATPRMRAGVRFPVSLKAGDTFGFASAPVNFEQLTSLLQTFSKTMAVSKNQSPNDYAMQRTAPASGFAKLLDSLPKIDERKRNVERWTVFEQEQLWPIIGALLVRSGDFPSDVSRYSMRVTFPDYELPKSEQEEMQRLEWKFRHNLLSPAEYMAEQEGITIEQAQEKIKQSAELNASTAPKEEKEEEQQPKEEKNGFSGRLAALVNKR